jgi:ABC-type transport system involved in multi-copper enzyme maturation permease subunit
MSAAAIRTGKPRWDLWRRQLAAILRLEIKKNFFGRRAILLYLMAIGPVLLFGALMLFEAADEPGLRGNFNDLNIIFANLYEGLILRTVVFFGCAWMFMNLFRGEVVDKSLHYYFLCPLRREVLVGGKYLSGLVAAVVLFTITTAGSLFFLYVGGGYPKNVEHLLDGPGLGQVAAYLGITVLGCVGYGALFLIVGLFFRNPIVPALVIYGWEAINFLLPPVLKRISVIYYLHSLSPVPVPEGPFAMVAEPAPAWIAIAGLLLLAAVILVFAGLRIRRMELRYGGE